MAEEMTVDTAPKGIKDLYNKGFVALERNNIDFAVELFAAVVEKEPLFHQARKYLRIAQIKKSKGKKGNTLTSIAGMPAIMKINSLVKAGKPMDALREAEKLLRNDPLNMKYNMAFVRAAVAADMPDLAVQNLELITDYYTEDIEFINMMGQLYQSMGRTSSAKQCFEKLCELCPNDPDVLKALKDSIATESISKGKWEETGSFRSKMKDTKEAEKLEKESKAVKTDLDADFLIADTIAKIQAEPGNINYYRALSRLYVQKLMFDEAIEALGKAVELSPGDPELENALSVVKLQRFDNIIAELQKTGDMAAVEAMTFEKLQFEFDDLQDRVKRYPNDFKLRYDWGVMLYNNEYHNEAIQQFQLAQRNPKCRIQALYYLAMCFKAKGQYDMAVQQLEKASSELYLMDANKKDAIYELGVLNELMGKKDKAMDYFKQIYQVDISYKDIAQKIESAYK